MRACRVLATCISGIAVVATPALAHALGPVDVELAAKGGYGTTLSNGPSDLLGGGLGARAGVSFFDFYAGVDVVYYLGHTVTPVPGETVSADALMTGVDLGYGFHVPLLTIRPVLGVGDFFARGTVDRTPCMYCQITEVLHSTSSQHNLYFEPGVTVLVPLGVVFLGADANLFIVPHNIGESGDPTQLAFTLHGQVGVHF
jgi:hypothetical protein